ncbi:MAG TPA: GTP-binding protein, partial [Rhodocyclaceae bacterium]|nr:GTP-binding protein [Rhodocyclaceae bacterium]
MASVSTSRSIAVIGHGAAGKTSLVEALLYAAGTIPAKGSIEKGSTVCDFDPLEKEVGHSLASALAYCRGADGPLYFIDTPGYPDFAGQALAALAAVDTALLVINAQAGIELMSERTMRWAGERKLCRMIVVNKIDADNLDLVALVADIRERFGKACLLLDLPAHGARDVVEVLGHDAGDVDFDSVASAHRALIDQLLEEDETLLARYLEDGADPAPGELHAPFEKAMRAGHLIPILFVSAQTGAGVRELLQVLAVLAPTPAESNSPQFHRGEPGGDAQPFAAEPDAGKHVLAHVFKIVSDPYHGRVAVFRVHQGTLKKDAQLFIGDGKRPFKVTHLYRLQGKDFIEVEALLPGDLGAIAKVDDIAFDAVLHDSHDEDHLFLKPLEFPRPMAGLAV